MLIANMSDHSKHFESWPSIGAVEQDRYCESCGHNLIGQIVRRDNPYGLLVVLCPECGKFAPGADASTAGYVWSRRLMTFLLTIWVMSMSALVLVSVLGQFGIMLGTLHEFTSYDWHTEDATLGGNLITTIVTNSGSSSSLGAALSQVPSLRTGTISRTVRGEIILREEVPYYAQQLFLLVATSGALGFLLALLVVVFCFHWKRYGYYTLIFIVPLVAGGATCLVWWGQASNLISWSAKYTILHALAHALGGCVGILSGRPLVRLLAHVALPQSARSKLSFLWLADGKVPPSHEAQTTSDVEV